MAPQVRFPIVIPARALLHSAFSHSFYPIEQKQNIAYLYGIGSFGFNHAWCGSRSIIVDEDVKRRQLNSLPAIDEPDQTSSRCSADDAHWNWRGERI